MESFSFLRLSFPLLTVKSLSQRSLLRLKWVGLKKIQSVFHRKAGNRREVIQHIVHEAFMLTVQIYFHLAYDFSKQGFVTNLFQGFWPNVSESFCYQLQVLFLLVWLSVEKNLFQVNLKEVKVTSLGTFYVVLFVSFNPLSAYPLKRSNTLKQFVGCCRRIV